MTWQYDISEISAGRYKCIGQRDSGHTVSIDCSEIEIYRIVKSALEFEVKLGSDLHSALYYVALSAGGNWTGSYLSHDFGSWHVEAIAPTERRIEYDGKEGLLSCFQPFGELKWEGPIEETSDIPDDVYRLLSPAAA